MKKQLKSGYAKMQKFDPVRDLTSKRFGKWIVLKYLRRIGCQELWLCRCQCGVEKNVNRNNLIEKLSTQCQRCAWDGRRNPHKLLLKLWKNKIQRGQLPEEWQNFDTFRKAVGDPPQKFTRLGRYDLTRPHGPGNSFWMTKESVSQVQEIRQKLTKQSVLQDKVLQKIHTAKTNDERKRYIVAAKKAGYTIVLIAIAAGLTHQRIQQIIAKTSKAKNLACKEGRRKHG